MGYVDEAYQELSGYCPQLTKREDFDQFWEDTIRQTKAVPLRPEVRQIEYPTSLAKVYDISYNGFDDTRIHGWFVVPTNTGREKNPCVITLHGAGGNRGTPTDHMRWIVLGVAVLAVEYRDQTGDTGNAAAYTSGCGQNAVSKGLLDKNEYYYRAVYMDCIKALDFAETRPEVDTSRIIINGGSMGGAVGMAVCSLDSRPWLGMVDVPSNSNLEKRVQGAHGTFSSVTDYLKKQPDKTDRVFETLSYFDTMNMADRIKCEILASVALNDPICPARMYFASYNRIKSPKQIKIYPFNGHEGGQNIHENFKFNFLGRKLQEDVK